MKMKRIVASALLLLWLACPAVAQDGSAVSTVKAASTAVLAEESQGLDVVWSGRGQVAGEMLDATFTNSGKQSQTVRLVPGLILTDLGGSAQPIMLEDAMEFTLAPGESKSTRPRGYCLDFEKDPPAMGAKTDFQITENVGFYENAIRALWAGLRLDRDGQMKPALKPLQHRTIAIQRAIWASLGGTNPATQDKLDADLRQDTRDSGLQFSDEKVHWLADQIWNDV